ncbi:MAG TPA: ribosome maturation factor RimM [Methylomirabilota bacterium]|nr:ribosome maturation factor RimM [Methylomirabilota bacterium]
MSERLIPLGEIVTTHGLDGWLKLNPFNPETTALFSVRIVYLEKDGIRSEQELESIKPHRSQFLVKCRGINGIGEAGKLIGSTLSIPEASLPLLDSGEYYHYQAIGLEVFDLRGKRIGIITRTWSTAGGELYAVQGENREYLIPAVKEIIEKVDLAAGKIIVNPPDGLLDL